MRACLNKVSRCNGCGNVSKARMRKPCKPMIIRRAKRDKCGKKPSTAKRQKPKGAACKASISRKSCASSSTVKRNGKNSCASFAQSASSIELCGPRAASSENLQQKLSINRTESSCRSKDTIALNRKCPQCTKSVETCKKATKTNKKRNGARKAKCSGVKGRRNGKFKRAKSTSFNAQPNMFESQRFYLLISRLSHRRLMRLLRNKLGGTTLGLTEMTGQSTPIMGGSKSGPCSAGRKRAAADSTCNDVVWCPMRKKQKPSAKSPAPKKVTRFKSNACRRKPAASRRKVNVCRAKC